MRDYYDYRAAEVLPVIGARIWVPFHHKIRLGVVIAYGEPSCDPGKIKAIEGILDDSALLSEDMLALAQWISQYYQSPLSEVLPLCMPKNLREGASATLKGTHYYHLALELSLTLAQLPKRAGKQHALADLLAQSNHPLSASTLSKQGFSHAVLAKLLEKDLLHVEHHIDKPQHVQHSEPALALHPEQAHAVETIAQSLHQYQCFLLQGVTGSGKTEVYLQLIARVLASGKQVLVLVPEIGLTPQLLERFQRRFSQSIVVLHSALNEGERQQAWLLAKENLVQLVIGTRSAIFTPMPQLGMIIIDEEHDSSFKQMDGVRYSARDTAMLRAYRANVPIILGSATPSLESLHNSQQGKYTLLKLTHKAMTNTPLRYRIVDLRNLSLQHGLASTSLQRIEEHLSQGNQVLVFINRRGFAPVLLCHRCGWMADCRACDSHLTLHRQANNLTCHHCGSIQHIPHHCQSCQGNELIPIGAGTQRLHEFLQQHFPDISITRIDRDEVRKKHDFEEKLADIHNGKTQLIIGTQMLAKGHHFPNLSLVLIVDMDSGFYNHDFRASEQLGQLITQVAGRAGRAEHPGEVVLQTHVPQHPLLNILVKEGYERFSEALLSNRQQSQLPPYQFLAVIRAQHGKQAKVLHCLHQIKLFLREQNVQILGPAPAPLARKANEYRMQLLLKSASRQRLQNTLTELREWITIKKLTNNIRFSIDVDPMDLS